MSKTFVREKAPSSTDVVSARLDRIAQTVLKEEQAVGLLRRLATDDDFRRRYECDPSDALLHFGLPRAMIEALPAANLVPVKLADKSHFLAALNQLFDRTVQVFLCQQPPQFQFGNGKLTRLGDAS